MLPEGPDWPQHYRDAGKAIIPGIAAGIIVSVDWELWLVGVLVGLLYVASVFGLAVFEWVEKQARRA